MSFYFNSNFVFIEKKSISKFKVLIKISRSFSSCGITNRSWKEIFNDICQREKEGNTYIDNGICLPHMVYEKLSLRSQKKMIGALVVLQLQKPLRWNNDSPPVKMVWGLLSTTTFHLRILKEISSLISQPSMIKKLYHASPEVFTNLIKNQFSHLTENIPPISKPKKFSRNHFLKTCHFYQDFSVPPGFVIHARPAAKIAKQIKSLPGNIFFVTSNHCARSNSVTALLGLGIGAGSLSSETLTIAIRYPGFSSLSLSRKKILEKNAFYSFRQIQSLIMSLSLNEFKKNKIKQEHDSTTKHAFKDNPYYKSLLKQTLKNQSTFKINILSTRYLPEKHGFFLGGPVLIYKRTLNNSPLSTPFKTNDSHFPLIQLLQISEQILLFKKAIQLVVEEIENSLPHKSQNLKNHSNKDEKDQVTTIMLSHIEILNDSQIHKEVKTLLLSLSENRKKSSLKKSSLYVPAIIQAWDELIKTKITLIKKNFDSTYHSRILDWQDLGQRVSVVLQKLIQQNHTSKNINKKLTQPSYLSSPLKKIVGDFFKKQLNPFFLICDDLYPSEVIELITPIEKGKISGIVVGKGSKNSHSSIMLSNTSIPVVFFSHYQEFTALLKQLQNQSTSSFFSHCVLDLKNNQIFGFTNKTENHKVLSGLKKENQKILQDPISSLYKQLENIPKETYSKKSRGNDYSFLEHDGLEFFINLNSLSELDLYKKNKHKFPYNQIKGVGLMRTELLFSSEIKKPSLIQQKKIYEKIAAVFHPLPVIIRTLDLAQDKPIFFLHTTKDNTSNFFEQTKKITHFNVKEKKFLSEQISAVSQAASSFSNIKILFPMISSLEEFFFYYHLLHEAYQHLLSTSSIPSVLPIEVGVMIEAPSLIYQIKTLNRFVDFYSIGGNDLEQFLILESRNNFSSSYSLQHIPLLLAAEKILHHTKEKPVTLCGNQATNPYLLSDFITTGIKRFSIPLSGIEKISRLSFSPRNTILLSRLKKYFLMEKNKTSLPKKFHQKSKVPL